MSKVKRGFVGTLGRLVGWLDRPPPDWVWNMVRRSLARDCYKLARRYEIYGEHGTADVLRELGNKSLPPANVPAHRTPGAETTKEV